MLEPQTRAALTDLLHPPAGFSLGHAVGTTYTLDLDTALTIPLSFAAKRVTAEDDTLGILDAVRRAGERVDIFAQAGQISIDLPPSALVAFLEPMVHPVTTQRGIFHPKVWFLEYERGDERAYRFVCASRNLTDDRSWDVVISLDGHPAEPSAVSEAADRNSPLVRLLRWLPTHTVTPLSSDRRTRINDLADRWSGIEWTAPPDIHDLQFHVWGVGERPSPEFWGIRGLFISPFLTDEGLSELKQGVYGQAYLVSRATSIDALAPATLDKRLRTTYVLDDAANPEAENTDPSAPSTLAGLHAKMYAFDRQGGTHVFLGSLNATGPALHSNVEVMVEVVGPKRKFGVEQTLAGLGDFLQEFEYTGGLEESEDDIADRDLSQTLGRIASVPLHARVVAGDPYSLEFWRDGDVPVPADVELSWHPVSRMGLAIPGLPGPSTSPTVVDGLALVDITPFVVVTARDSRGDRSAQRTVVLAELRDDPADRQDAVIAAHLTGRDAFLRFLMLLLELGGVLTLADGQGAWDRVGSGESGIGLFEALLRSVGPGQTGLADVERIVGYLSKQPGGTEVLPPGFTELWASVWAAQQTIIGDRRA